MDKQHFLITGFIGLAIYLIASGLSYGAFTYIGKTSGGAAVTTIATTGGTQQHFYIDPSIPRTQPCPLNGKLYTKQEETVWQKRRPLAVMIENHAEARPQSGLSLSDVVYEAVAEGGITRLMGVFYCGIAAGSVNLAPVRSARTYFLPWVLEYDALYNHVGGAGVCSDPTVDERAKALCQIDEYNIKDMDQFGISFPTCYRNPDRLDHPVATEHSMVCATDKLLSLAASRGWTNVDASGVAWDKNFVSWKFKDDPPAGDRGASFSATFTAWKGYADYTVKWVYDPPSNSYKRFTGGAAQMDLETKEQLSAKDIVILFATETGPVDEHLHLLYATIGSGSGILYQDGKTVKVTWKKPTRTSRTQFFDTTGKEISFNRGQIWIEMLPTGTPITY